MKTLTLTKDVEVEVTITEADALSVLGRSGGAAEKFLDVLDERGFIEPLSPIFRQELLAGTRDLRSVLV